MFNSVTVLILRDLFAEGGHFGGAVQRLGFGGKRADESCASDLYEVSDEGEESADEPGQAGGDPDAPDTDEGEQREEEREADPADNFDDAVGQGEACITDAVEDAAADIDRAEG